MPTINTVESTTADLLQSVNEASKRCLALWLTFLLAGAYLTAVLGTTTHERLLLEAPITVPPLGIQIPLLAFYLCAPVFFLVFHVYVLVELHLLARVLQLFNAALAAPAMRVRSYTVRAKLDNFIVTQCLAGPPETWWVRWLLQLLVRLSLVIAPVGLLMFFELRFLPYHSQLALWVHRIVLLVDLLSICVLWPAIVAHRPPTTTPPSHPRRPAIRFAAAAASLTVAAVAFFVLVIPDGSDSVAEQWRDAIVDRNLVIRNLILIERDETKLKNLNETLLLSYRDLRHADLTGADLRKANLSSADLQGAVLSSARLDEAKLEAALLHGATLVRASLERAQLRSVQLQGSLLDGTNLKDAMLEGANWDGASAQNADFTGAFLRHTSARGADVSFAKFDRSQFGESSVELIVATGTELMPCQQATHLDSAPGSSEICQSAPIGVLAEFLCDRGPPHPWPGLLAALQRQEPPRWAKAAIGHLLDAKCYASQGIRRREREAIAKLSDRLSVRPGVQ